MVCFAFHVGFLFSIYAMMNIFQCFKATTKTRETISLNSIHIWFFKKFDSGIWTNTSRSNWISSNDEDIEIVKCSCCDVVLFWWENALSHNRSKMTLVHFFFYFWILFVCCTCALVLRHLENDQYRFVLCDDDENGNDKNPKEIKILTQTNGEKNM